MILEDAPENNPNYIIDNINSAGINRKYKKMNCPRCGYELKSIACKTKCLNCAFAIDCSDM